jgi:hypothetical protein
MFEDSIKLQARKVGLNNGEYTMVMSGMNDHFTNKKYVTRWEELEHLSNQGDISLKDALLAVLQIENNN